MVEPPTPLKFYENQLGWHSQYKESHNPFMFQSPPSRIHVAHSWCQKWGQPSNFGGKTSGFCAPKNMSNISHVPSPSQNPAVDFKGKTGVDMNAKLPNIYIYIYIYTYIYIRIYIYINPNISSNVIAQVLQKYKWTLWSSSCTSAQYRKANVGQLRLQDLKIMFHCGSSKLHHCQKKGHP